MANHDEGRQAVAHVIAENREEEQAGVLRWRSSRHGE
jgi:hypothetical protein